MSREIVSSVPFDNVVPTKILQDLLHRELKEPFIATGIHITTLNAFVSGILTQEELGAADLIYADGVSVSLLMRMGGLRQFRRVSTTDLVHELFFTEGQNDSFRIALLGGTSEVSVLARISWINYREFDAVWAHHGFENNWDAVIEDMREFAPNIVLVGLGMPKELKLLLEERNRLPPAIYLTCGGYLRLLAGTEKRSPVLMQILKIEWLYRLTFHPNMTFSRYSRGIFTLIKLLVQIERNKN